jgi:hypothetical protein
MNQVSPKTIARLLIMLLLMTPLTGIAMQWSAQSFEMNHCDGVQLKESGHVQTFQHHCNMNADCQQMCNSAEHCSSTSISILNGFNSTINPDDSRIFFGSGRSIHSPFILNELFRPPRA